MSAELSSIHRVDLEDVSLLSVYSSENLREVARNKPDRELWTEDGYRWILFDEKRTGLTMVGLEDLSTKVTLCSPLANPNKRTAAYKAWGGARQSRAPGKPWIIYQEMGEKGVDPDQKVEELFSTYGHTSPAGMADMMRDADGVPFHYCLVEFYDQSLNDGQEKSTRYQPKFGEVVLLDLKHFLPVDRIKPRDLFELESGYQELGELSQQLFNKHKTRLSLAFTEHFKPKTIRQRNSLESRVLDCARYFLLLGQRTAMSNNNSAREWSRTIADLKASPIKFYQRMGDHMIRFFSPTKEEEELLGFKAEAPSLIRHTESATTTNENIGSLRVFLESIGILEQVPVDIAQKGVQEQTVELLGRRYTEGDKMVAQYVKSIWPGMDRKALLDWVYNQSDLVKGQISEIICNGHHCNNEMTLLAATRGITLVYECDLGVLRDFNRHRAWGRFLTLPFLFGEKVSFETVRQILAKGFILPSYLADIPEFSKHRAEFEQDMSNLFSMVKKFIMSVYKECGDVLDGDYSFAVNLLPMSLKTELWMHGDPKQVLYFHDRRRRPGGHVNYIQLAAEAGRLVRESDPYLSGMVFPQPQPFSRDEFFNRG